MGKSYFCKVPLMSVLSCKCIRVSIVVSPVLSNEEIIIYMYLPILSRSLKTCIHAPDRSEDPCFGFLFIYSLFDLWDWLHLFIHNYFKCIKKLLTGSLNLCDSAVIFLRHEWPRDTTCGTSWKFWVSIFPAIGRSNK